MEQYLHTLGNFIFNPVFMQNKAIEKFVKEGCFEAENILDFGCGDQRHREPLSKYGNYTGLDVSSRGDNQESIVIYDGIDVPLESNSFDLIVCTEVLEHVVDLNKTMSEMKRILKPGGCAIITIPFFWIEHEMPYDFRRFTSIGMQQFMEEAGFKTKTLKKLGGSSVLVQIALVSLRAKLSRFIGRVLANILFGVLIAPMNLASLLSPFKSEDRTVYSNVGIIIEK